MNPTIRRTVTRTFSCSLSRTFARSLAVVCLLVLTATARAEQWTTPTPYELAMTSQPEAPGAAVVYLYKE